MTNQYGCDSCGNVACSLADTNGPGCNGWVHADRLDEVVTLKVQLPPAPRSIVLSADIEALKRIAPPKLGSNLPAHWERKAPLMSDHDWLRQFQGVPTKYMTQGETDAPGTPRPADCRCRPFRRCEPCIGRLMALEYKRVLAPTVVEHRDACTVEFVAPSIPCETCGVEEGALHLPSCSVLLDVEYDGMSLRMLLVIDADKRRETGFPADEYRPFTPAQRAVLSAHWSAQLRAKVDAAKQSERNAVTYCELDPDD